MNRHLSCGVIAAMSASFLLAALRAGDAVADDLRQLQGTWSFQIATTSSDAKGKAEVKITACKLTVEGNRFVLLKKQLDRPDPEFKEDFRGTLQIDPRKSPKHLDLVRADGAEPALRGLYRFDGERLEICHGPKPNQRPAEFEAGDQSTIWGLSRESKGK